MEETGKYLNDLWGGNLLKIPADAQIGGVGITVSRRPDGRDDDTWHIDLTPEQIASADFGQVIRTVEYMVPPDHTEPEPETYCGVCGAYWRCEHA